MRGFPKQLSTKQDYLNCIADFPEETKNALQLLLDTRYTWFRVKEGESIPEGENYRVSEYSEAMEEDTPKIEVLEEYREDPNALIFLRGFTVNEVQELIQSLE